MKSLDEKDWIIIRLLRILVRTGDYASHSDVVRSIDWFEHEHRDFGERIVDYKTGETSYGPMYGTGSAKLMNCIRQIHEPIFNKETQTWSK